MAVGTIDSIKDYLSKIDAQLIIFRKTMKENNSELDKALYGSESEYSLNALYAGIKNIYTDIKFLTSNECYYIKYSTYDERQKLNSHLSNLYSYIQNDNYSQIAAQIDYIKSLLRGYNLRTDKKRLIAFDNALDELTRKAVGLEDQLQKSKQIVEGLEINAKNGTTSNEEIQSKLEEVSAKTDEYNTLVDDMAKLKDKIEDMASDVESNLQSSSSSLSAIKSNQSTIKEFTNKIDEREEELVKQAKVTDEYEQKLTQYSTEHQSILDEAKDLIDKAKQALSYSTAEGLSASFDSHYKRLDGWRLWIWMVAAGLLIIAAACIGIWLISGAVPSDGNINHMWIQIAGKLSMIPLLVTAAVFCARQFSKQKTLLEDYGYKLTLAKSMVAFSEELRDKDPEKYKDYLTKVLEEIHQDPLRVRPKEVEDSEAIDTSVLNRINELASIITKIQGLTK